VDIQLQDHIGDIAIGARRGAATMPISPIAPAATMDLGGRAWCDVRVDVVVLVKWVPNATAERRLDPVDFTTDRTSVDGLLSELDEYVVEEALKIVESHGGEVTVLTMGPAPAAGAVRKALQMGADNGVHVLDDALHGSDAIATSRVLAAALLKIGQYDLVLTGMASTDGGMSVIPAMLAERLGLPQLTFAAQVRVEGDSVAIRRDGDTASETIEAELPALVSVTDQINHPRYPSFKGIMAAKKKPVQTWSLQDLSVEASTVGLAAAWTAVESATPRPARQRGTVIVDQGDGGVQLAEFLAIAKFI
jgi:electron transfer flavoprotein beta subunit